MINLRSLLLPALILLSVAALSLYVNDLERTIKSQKRTINSLREELKVAQENAKANYFDLQFQEQKKQLERIIDENTKNINFSIDSNNTITF